MNLLLDSHTLLWLDGCAPHFSKVAAALIADPANRLHLSMASVWEISIKFGLKKIGLSLPIETFLDGSEWLRIGVVPITTEDCVDYSALPFPDPRHRDPFDRMIITHALRNKLSVIGSDEAFDLYGITRLW